FQIWTQRQNNLVQEIFLRKHICTFEIDNEKLSFDNFNPKSITEKNLQLFHFLFSKDEIFVEQFLTDYENKMPFKIPITPMMTWENLKDALNKYEIELGSHSLSHIALSNTRDNAKLQEEISGSKILIEKHTGRKVNIFALPNGNYNDEVIEQCRHSGYKHVLTVDEKLFTKEDISEFKLPRLLIPYNNFYENLLKVENFQNVIKKIIK
ncbi:MAG TPA: polysaccharide deacetylase family protein, partial [Hanamia sp.]|nr:polysaccharide deacetylase family protein [Hanamia sp.]